MPNERNNDTRESVNREVRALQSSCVDACNIVNNAPSDIQGVSAENIVDKTLQYMYGLLSVIDNYKNAVASDDNSITSQFLTTLNQKVIEIEQLKILTRSYIYELDNEIER